MSINIDLTPAARVISTTWRFTQGIVSAVSGRVQRIIRTIRNDKKAMWLLRFAARWALAVLLVVLYTLVVSRVAYKKALVVYDGWLADYKAAQIAAAEEAARTAPVDPYEAQLDAEAELLARVLYGVKDNDEGDLKTYCWCVFNRVENKAFPDTLEDVIAQPNQWMRYDPTNPILENLFQLAREQLNAWHKDSHRPVSNEYVFMNWSTNDICLRNVWSEGSGTKYWRWNQ